jgi:biotin carboxyl carrier protein
MELNFVLGDREEKLSVEEKDGLWLARFGDRVIEAEVVPVGLNAFRIALAGESAVTYVAENEGTYYVFMRGRQYSMVRATSEVKRKSAVGDALKGEELVAAPMPGVIVKVPVSEGDVVAAEQVLVVVESMKMENNIRAHGEARVKRVHVKPGDSVNFNSPLVELEPVSPQSA